VVVVVALVGVKFGGAASAWSAAGADGRYPAYEGFQGLAVVEVGGGDADGERQTAALGDQVDL
jgi:hypothetical protein